MSRGATFIGRAAELACFDAVLDAGADGRFVAAVVGDAGVGKSRLVVEVAARARRRGLVVLRGECLPLASELPLLPVAEALRGLWRGTVFGKDAGLAAELPGQVRVELCRLFPELGSSVPDQVAELTGWGQQRLFWALREALSLAAGTIGVLLVVEDVHWADPSTFDFLTFLTRSTRMPGISLVVTARGDEAPGAGHFQHWLTEFQQSPEVVRAQLAPMSWRETAELLGQLGAPAGPALVDSIFSRSGGNCFFSEELLAAALEEPGGRPVRKARRSFPGASLSFC